MLVWMLHWYRDARGTVEIGLKLEIQLSRLKSRAPALSVVILRSMAVVELRESVSGKARGRFHSFALLDRSQPPCHEDR